MLFETRRPNQSVALSDVAELESAAQRGPQFWVYRYDPGLAALPLADVDAGELSLRREVAGLQGQRLRDPEAGPPLDQEQQPCPRVGRRPYQGLDLVGLQLLRQLLRRPLTTVRVPGPGMLSPGSSVARDDGLLGCHERAPGHLEVPSESV